jgi:hypothetical protein
MGKAQYKTDKPQKERDPFDFYPTEPELARAVLKEFAPTNFYTEPLVILDPGAGTGVWGQVARELFPKAIITGVEIQDLPCPAGYNMWYAPMDFRHFQSPYLHYDFIIGNPPFNGADYRPPLWEQFFTRAWQLLAPGGRVVWLLPLDIITGIERYKRLWLKYPMLRHAPCMPRPSHNGDDSRKTPFREEGIAAWIKDHNGNAIGIPGEWSTKPLVWRE